MKRRTFITLPLAIGASLYFPNKSNAVILGLLRYVFQFASAVGASVVANHITDYLKNGVSSQHSNKILEVNEDMKKAQYPDLSQSIVYSPKESKSIMYPALTKDKNDICMPVVRTDNNSMSAMLEGPSIIALSEAASYFNKQNSGSSKKIANEITRGIFFPTKIVNNGNARFGVTGREKEHYKTQEGDVVINFDGNLDATGIVSIEARKGGLTIFYKEYDTKLFRRI